MIWACLNRFGLFLLVCASICFARWDYSDWWWFTVHRQGQLRDPTTHTHGVVQHNDRRHLFWYERIDMRTESFIQFYVLGSQSGHHTWRSLPSRTDVKRWNTDDALLRRSWVRFRQSFRTLFSSEARCGGGWASSPAYLFCQCGRNITRQAACRLLFASFFSHLFLWKLHWPMQYI